MKNVGAEARAFYEIGVNSFIVPTNKGVYRYEHVDGMPSVSRISPSDYGPAQVTSNEFGGTVKYWMANAVDNFLYSSDNCRIWKKEFRPVSSGSLNSLYQRNSREWYFGLDSGLYKSSYRYAEVEDLDMFSEDDMYRLYARLMSSDISAECEEAVSGHETDPSYMAGHLSSLVYDINTNLLGVDFDGLQSSGWQKHSGEPGSGVYQVSNDVVFEQKWGTNADWNLSLSVENQFVSQPNARFTYLYRRWMSGLTEIYVHVPTTNTYYVNHLPSTPNYTITPEITELTASNVSQFGKDKQVFRHDPNAEGVYTRMKLAVSKSMFNIDALLGVYACGNSLPLKIYKETVQENGTINDYQAAQYFNSYVAPSPLLSYDSDGEDDVFEFACFGADEQVIRLEFIDTVNRFDQAYYRIVFNSNGLGSDPDSFVKQRIRADGKAYRLRRNQYEWP